MEDALIEYGVHKAGLTYEEASRNMTLSRVSPHVAVAVATSPNPNEPYGFDHNYVVFQDEENELNWIGTLEDEKSGRRMRVFADAPGVQLYTGNWLDGSESSAFFPQWQGMCLETQAYPDSIFDVDSDLSEFANGKCFVLRPNKSVYTHRVEYLFEPTD
jgi:galactose mutarotase-like enzyme